MIDKIKDLLSDSRVRSALFFVGGFIVFGCVLGFGINNAHKEKTNVETTPTPSAEVVIETTVPDDDSTTVSTPEATTESSETVTNQEDKSVEQKLADYMNSLDGFENYNADNWECVDLSQYAEKDSAFQNLFRYQGYGNYAAGYKYESVDGTASYTGKEDALATVYATVNGDDVTIHKVSVAGDRILNDGFITDEMLLIMDGH